MICIYLVESGEWVAETFIHAISFWSFNRSSKPRYIYILCYLNLSTHHFVSFISFLSWILFGVAQVSSLFWSLNTDLHQEKVTNALEYISTMKANLEPFCPSSDGKRNALENLFLVHQDFGKGRFHIRFKLRKGRVRVMVSFSLALFSVPSMNII